MNADVREIADGLPVQVSRGIERERSAAARVSGVGRARRKAQRRRLIDTGDVAADESTASGAEAFAGSPAGVGAADGERALAGSLPPRSGGACRSGYEVSTESGSDRVTISIKHQD